MPCARPHPISTQTCSHVAVREYLGVYLDSNNYIFLYYPTKCLFKIGSKKVAGGSHGEKVLLVQLVEDNSGWQSTKHQSVGVVGQRVEKNQKYCILLLLFNPFYTKYTPTALKYTHLLLSVFSVFVRYHIDSELNILIMRAFIGCNYLTMGFTRNGLFFSAL